jgi:two-component system, OmpR family, sensor histidine kinase ChvG
MKPWEMSQLGMGVAGLIAIGLWSVSSVWHYRTTLIDAQVERLAAQGEIIAGAIVVPASGEPSAAKIDPSAAKIDRFAAKIDPTLPVRRPVAENELASDEDAALNALANLPWIAPLLGDTAGAGKTRARVYDRRGVLRLDTDLAGTALRFDPPSPPPEPTSFTGRTLLALKNWLLRHDPPPDEMLGVQNGQGIPEVMQALAGHRASRVRGSSRDEVSVSVAVPIVRFRTVRGAILLSTKVSGWFDLVRAMKADRGLSAAASNGA